MHIFVKNKFPVLMIFVVAIIFMSGKTLAEQHKRLTLPVNSTKLASLQYFYNSFHNGETELFLPDNYKKYARAFNAREVTIPVKGQNFISPFVSYDDNYYELGRFYYKDYMYKMIAYNKIGECDTLLLNIQLNAYDSNNTLTDALLLSSFFAYEDAERYAHFAIYLNYTINIDNYIVYRYKEDDKGGSVIPIKNPKPQLFLNEKYKIEKGRFLLISSR